MTPTLLGGLLITLAYVSVGAFREVLVVTYYKLIAKNRRYSVSGLAGAIELYDLLVLATVIQSGWNPVLLGAYVVGVMLGTLIGMGPKK
jgi:hypothetical protein